VGRNIVSGATAQTKSSNIPECRHRVDIMPDQQRRDEHPNQDNRSARHARDQIGIIAVDTDKDEDQPNQPERDSATA
jgi:hypothetical protein